MTVRSHHQKYYDAIHKRLVYVGDEATEAYWDTHWLGNLTSKDIRRPDRFVVSVTQRHLPLGAKVLDAGCGIARTVFGLKKAGYDAYGIDFAPKTVSAINKLVPELDVRFGDVRNISIFPDGFFDGVWSLGVIEHFYEGYSAIVDETYRLVREGGYAFVTVPSMSPLRRLKARTGQYRPWENPPQHNFYQFALTPATVVDSFTAVGFKLCTIRNRGGFKGLKDEVSTLRPLLQSIYDSDKPALRLIRALLDKLCGPVSCHTKLYIFKKSRNEKRR